MEYSAIAAFSLLFALGCFGWTFLQKRHLQKRRREQTLFYASLGHELKTPLNGILGFTELLMLENNDPKQQRDFIKNIDFSARVLLTMIDNMLDCAKLNAGEMRFRLQPCDPAALAGELPAILNSLLKEKNLHLHIEQPAPLPQIEIDPDRLRQIFLNLIGNAIKYSDRGIITLQLEWRAKNADSGLLKFSVADQGQGIPEEYRKRIFEPFVQQERHSMAGNGTGLGLSITLRLIELMHGSIELESELDHGSCFFVTLPCRMVS